MNKQLNNQEPVANGAEKPGTIARLQKEISCLMGSLLSAFVVFFGVGFLTVILAVATGVIGVGPCGFGGEGVGTDAVLFCVPLGAALGMLMWSYRVLHQRHKREETPKTGPNDT
jgi:hypothetical protein